MTRRKGRLTRRASLPETYICSYRGYRNGRAAGRSQASIDVFEKRRHLMAVKAPEQSYRLDRSFGGARPMP
jgi:hypothetical protein